MIIGGTKKLLVLLRSKKYSHLFTEKELAAIRELCLPTYDSNDPEKLEDAKKNKGKYVLKKSNSRRGWEVTIGKNADQEEWERLLKSQGTSVLQDYVDLYTEKILDPTEKHEYCTY
ncbi:MAG: hypothetical protein O7C59_04445, partial [Rickettsia endosymbiont of Ixodes persulcatus]|nr:hypothetical protein [Rickettsia endosymbiont of Ixodes persulcatus]